MADLLHNDSATSPPSTFALRYSNSSSAVSGAGSGNDIKKISFSERLDKVKRARNNRRPVNSSASPFSSSPMVTTKTSLTPVIKRDIADTVSSVQSQENSTKKIDKSCSEPQPTLPSSNEAFHSLIPSNPSIPTSSLLELSLPVTPLPMNPPTSPPLPTTPPPSTQQPTISPPLPTTPPPITQQPTTSPPLPTTPPPTTQQPTTSPPLPTTPPPITQQPTTSPPLPTTPPPTTQQPTTSPPLPTTPPPTTQQPTTSPPLPTTPPPTTQQPTTSPPLPTTPPPTTQQPTTSPPLPTTPPPTTQQPTTSPPLPTTPPPSTQLPTNPLPMNLPPATQQTNPPLSSFFLPSTQSSDDYSPSPVISPGQLKFSTTTINEASANNTPPSDTCRRQSSNFSQELHFKPNLKKWQPVNLNELNDMTPLSMITGVNPHMGGSSSGISHVSSSGLESIHESQLITSHGIHPSSDNKYWQVDTTTSEIELTSSNDVINSKIDERPQSMYNRTLEELTSSDDIYVNDLYYDMEASTLKGNHSQASVPIYESVEDTAASRQTKIISSPDSHFQPAPPIYDEPRGVSSKGSNTAVIQSTLKLHMHHIHSGIKYRMLRVNSATTCAELVTAALKRSNIIEDPNGYTIYLVHSTTKAVLKIVEPEEVILSVTSSGNTHWELRQRLDITRTIRIDVRLDLNLANCQKMTLTISSKTTSQEVVELIFRKLNIHKSLDHKRHRLLAIADGNDERMVGSGSPLISDRYKSEIPFKLVDIVDYLTKDLSYEKKSLPQTHNLESAQAVIEQCRQKIVQLEKRIVVHEYSLEQKEKDLLDALIKIDHLQHEMKTIKQEKEEEHQMHTRLVEELHETLSELSKENKEKTDEVSYSKKQKDNLEKKVQEKEVVILKIMSTNDTLKEQVDASRKKLNELNETLIQLQQKNESLMMKDLRNNEEVDHDGNEKSSLSVYSILTDDSMKCELLPVRLAKDILNAAVLDGVTVSSAVGEVLLPGDRFIELNGLNAKRFLSDYNKPNENGSMIEGVIARATTDTAQYDFEQSGNWKVDYTKLLEELKSTSCSLIQQEAQLDEKDRELEDIKQQIHVLKKENINSLRKQLVDNQPLENIGQNESLVDTLRDASKEEILDVLQTVETDCLKHKESLDKLFALIIGHTPELLSIMAEVEEHTDDDDDGDDESDDEYETKKIFNVANTGWC